jgi:hypothetical protein
MTELRTAYPATTPPPPASPGMAIHTLYDLSAHTGTAAHLEFVAAGDDEGRRAVALGAMPNATVSFYELPEDQPLFDVED